MAISSAAQEFIRLLRQNNRAGAEALAPQIRLEDSELAEIRKCLRELHGTTMPLSRFLQDFRKENRIQDYNDFSLSELNTLTKIYTYGAGAFAEPNYLRFLYAAGCMMLKLWGDSPVWISSVSDAEAEPAWDRYCRGGQADEICSFIETHPAVYHPKLATALWELYTALGWQNTNRARFQHILSLALDPLQGDDAADILVQCFDCRSPGPVALLRLLEKSAQSDHRLSELEALRGPVMKWALRILSDEAERGSVQAMYTQYLMGERPLSDAVDHGFAPAAAKDVEIALNRASDAMMNRRYNGSTFQLEEKYRRAESLGIHRTEEWRESHRQSLMLAARFFEMEAKRERERKQQQIDRELDEYRRSLNRKSTFFNAVATGVPLSGEEMTAFGRGLGAGVGDLGVDMQTLGILEENAITDKLAKRAEKLWREAERETRGATAAEDAEDEVKHRYKPTLSKPEWIYYGAGVGFHETSHWDETDYEELFRLVLERAMRRMKEKA